MLNFVHIPKTAGTSFRLAANLFFGDKHVLRDYGAHSEDTSELCQKFCYGGQEDRWALVKAGQELGVKMITGHIRADKYLPALSVTNTITFLRDPIQRLVSEYEHFLRHKGYKGDFEQFYNLPIMRNRYTKLLQGVPLCAVGFVGLTERYEASVRMINTMIGGDIRVLEENLGKQSVSAKHEIADEHAEEIRRLNAQDIILYDRAVSLFDQRENLFINRQPFVHGALATRGMRQVAGWAWSRLLEEPVVVEGYVGDKHVGAALATEFRPNLCRLGVPRGGYVGWTLPVDLREGETIECRVSGTGQLLGSYHFMG